ncbi:hypothetical protein J6590_056267 [Homalodisca vitripennis]|nr:hypothetical protein J6590_056267 [Homalodisca vitripennis]
MRERLGQQGSFIVDEQWHFGQTVGELSVLATWFIPRFALEDDSARPDPSLLDPHKRQGERGGRRMEKLCAVWRNRRVGETGDDDSRREKRHNYFLLYLLSGPVVSNDKDDKWPKIGSCLTMEGRLESYIRLRHCPGASILQPWAELTIRPRLGRWASCRER